MALGPNERWQSGFVVNAAANPPQLAMTTSLTGAKFSGGFLRDPDGRLVVRPIGAGEGVRVA